MGADADSDGRTHTDSAMASAAAMGRQRFGAAAIAVPMNAPLAAMSGTM